MSRRSIALNRWAGHSGCLIGFKASLLAVTANGAPRVTYYGTLQPSVFLPQCAQNTLAVRGDDFPKQRQKAHQDFHSWLKTLVIRSIAILVVTRVVTALQNWDSDAAELLTL